MTLPRRPQKEFWVAAVPYLGLGLICLVFAANRSFWTDEIVRLKQSELGLWLGLKSLFSEPSPFSPGEIVLNWICRTFFAWVLPAEIWARLPGIFWVLGAFAISKKIAKKTPFQYLPWFVFFSVSLLTVSVQMRPYGALIFSGALATDLILDDSQRKEGEDVKSEPLLWFTLLFTHLYGICLLSLTCLLTKRPWKGICGLAYAGIIVALCKIQVLQPGPIPGPLKLAMVVVFAIGNPHHASFILAPLAMIGSYVLWKMNSSQAWKLFAILFVATICPVAIDLAYRYFFAPRQVLAGIFPFLALSALGLRFVTEKMASPGIRKTTVASVFVASLVVPWFLSVILEKPPVSDQPMHRFRELVHEFDRDHVRSVFFLDPCNLGTLDYYFRTALSEHLAAPPEHFTLDGIAMERLCWNLGTRPGTCVTAPSALGYCWMKSDSFEKDPIATVLAKESGQFDRIVYELPRFPELPGLPQSQYSKLIRAW